jgi:hypothetical protein
MTYFPNRLTKTAPAPSTDQTWKLVDRWTRAGESGRFIKCPHCGAKVRVGHFSWSALQCTSCKTMIDKYRWSIRSRV